MMGVTEAMDARTSAQVNDDCDLSWVSHPVRLHPKKNLLVATVMLTTSVGLYFGTGDLGWGLIGAAVLMLGLYDYLLPTSFKLTAAGAQSRVLFFVRRKRWSSLRSFHADQHGVLLSPFRGRHRMEAHRGIYLRFVNNREAVLEAVSAHFTDAAE